MSKEITISNGITGTITSNKYDYDKRLATITPEEKAKYVAITSKLDTNDITSIQVYGSELNSIVAQNGDTLLKSVRADNSDEVVQLTNQLLAELDMIDIDELNTNTKWKRFLRNMPIVGKLVTSVQSVMNKYDSIAENVDKIAKKIDSAKVVAMRDNSTLQTIFDNNTQYIAQIRELIMAAKLKEQDITTQLNDMQAHSDQYEVYQINDLASFQNNLQKRIADMEITEYVLTQNLLQIRATQGNNIAIANKSDNIVNNIIPLWRNQLSMSVIMNNQTKSIEAQQKITDTTNRLMNTASDTLRKNSVAAAKANEEQIISLDTLKNTTNNLIETVKEVKKIHDDGAKQRAEIETSLQQMTQNLENIINDINNR